MGINATFYAIECNAFGSKIKQPPQRGQKTALRGGCYYIKIALQLDKSCRISVSLK